MTTPLDWLVEAVQTRPRPEDVAEAIVAVLGDTLTPDDRAQLAHVTRHSARALGWQYSSMAADFLRPTTGVQRQVQVASALWDTPPPLGTTPAEVLAYVQALAPAVGKVIDANDFRTDRLYRSKAARRAAGIHKNARWLNKRWRLLQRIEHKLARLAWNEQRYQATRLGKSGLATQLSADELRSDVGTLAFLAYLTARMSRRAAFTNAAQDRAFDATAAILLRLCEASPTTRWDLIAQVWPTQRVLQHLDDAATGRLLGRWWATLHWLADLLRQAWRTLDGIDRATMIVRRGQDSTTWNQLALAWNTTRQAWLETLLALRFEGFLDDMCPGKAMRLMAADVAAWHRLSGGQVHPDTRVWAALPLPWEVLSGAARCTQADVAAQCHTVGIDPATWLGARVHTPVPFRPTPELVHGVAVASPALAQRLRHARAFSGGPLRAPVPDGHVVRDSDGFAVYTEAVERSSVTERTALGP